MATLKMTTNDQNSIWLTNVKRVEQMLSFDPFHKTFVASDASPWEIAQKEIAKLKETNPQLHAIIEQRVLTYDNKSALTAVTKKDLPMLLLYVVLDVGDEVRPQNWLVGAGQNYLLENGKTVDRI